MKLGGLLARDGEQGATLIELLTVVVIIGALAVIAIPSLIAHRERAWQGAVNSDLRNAAIIMESYFSLHDRYPADGEVLFGTSSDITLVIERPANPGDIGSYCITGAHAALEGGAVVATVNSAAGGLRDTTIC